MEPVKEKEVSESLHPYKDKQVEPEYMEFNIEDTGSDHG